MYETKTLNERIWYRSLYFLISTISCILFIFLSLWTIDLKVNYSEYYSLFLFIDILLLVSSIGCMAIGYKITIN
jgi:hypothetical protein